MWIWSFFLLNRQSFYFFFPPPYSSKHKSFFKLVLKLLGTKSFLIPKTTLNMELDNCNLWTVPGTWMKQVWKLSQNFLEVYNQGHLHVQSHISKNIITIKLYFRHRAFLIAQLIKNLPAVQKTPPLIPESGRSAGEGIGYPLQYSWASIVAQLVKNLPAVRDT